MALRVLAQGQVLLSLLLLLEQTLSLLLWQTARELGRQMEKLLLPWAWQQRRLRGPSRQPMRQALRV